MCNKILGVIVIAILIGSCKQKNEYSVEIGYTISGLKGDSILTNKENWFTAPNDSVAFIKGAQDFATARLQKTDTSGKPTKFLVRNKKGDIILKPVNYK